MTGGVGVFFCFFFTNICSGFISFPHPFVPFVIWHPCVYHLLSSVSYQNKNEVLLIHSPFALVFLSRSTANYAGDWNDETASQKEKKSLYLSGDMFSYSVFTHSLNKSISI